MASKLYLENVPQLIKVILLKKLVEEKVFSVRDGFLSIVISGSISNTLVDGDFAQMGNL